MKRKTKRDPVDRAEPTIITAKQAARESRSAIAREQAARAAEAKRRIEELPHWRRMWLEHAMHEIEKASERGETQASVDDLNTDAGLEWLLVGARMAVPILASAGYKVKLSIGYDRGNFMGQGWLYVDAASVGISRYPYNSVYTVLRMDIDWSAVP